MLQIDDDGFDNFFMCFFSTKPVVITLICACRSLIEYFNLEHITKCIQDVISELIFF